MFSIRLQIASIFILLITINCSKDNDVTTERKTEPPTPTTETAQPAVEQTSEPTPESNLINASDHYQFTGRILEVIAKGNTDYPLDFTFHTVNAIKIVYNTLDHNQEKTVASGVLLLPEKTGNLPLLSLQHGTLLDPKMPPSKSKLGNNELTLAAILASAGIITFVPDYLGYGNSTLPTHPFEHRATLAQASYDMIKAAKHYLEQNNIATNDSLYIAGYSEGGFATIALQQKLEAEKEIQLIQSYAGAGAYNKTAFTKMILEAEEEQPHMGYYLWVLYSYNYLYKDLNRPWSAYVNEPYASKLSAVEEFYAPIADSLIIGKVDELFHSEFISGVINETDTAFLKALEDNSVYDWKPTNPIALFHSKSDSLVDISNSESMMKAIENKGGDISLHLLDAENHGAAAIPFYLAVLNDIMEKHPQK